MHPLIDTDGLASMLDGGDPPSVLDVRWRLGGPPGAESYAAGHLPGAVFVDLADLAGTPGENGRHPLPEPEDLQEVLRAAGVRRGRPVVAYDDGDGSIAARLWWLLRWAGHSEVAVLDGGYAGWVAEGRPVTTDESTPARGDIAVQPGFMPVLDADDAARLPATGVLLDARASERYTGEVEPIDPRGGHIPGAVNAPFQDHTGSDGRWKPAEELERRFAELGVDGRKPAGAYCGSGVTAASVVLAAEVAGLSAPSLYVGSWSHWSRDPQRPAATGPDPDAERS